MNHTCPVCGFNGLARPPRDFYICPCCGTEFENDDFFVTHQALREAWAGQGMPWFSQATAPPAGWNPGLQLAMLNRGLIGAASSQTKSSPVHVHISRDHIAAPDQARVSGFRVAFFDRLLDAASYAQMPKHHA